MSRSFGRPYRRDEAPAPQPSAPSSPAPSLAPVPHLAPVVQMPRSANVRGGRRQVAVVSMLESPVELAWPIAASSSRSWSAC